MFDPKLAREFLNKHKYARPVADEDLRGAWQAYLIEQLGFTVTHEVIEKSIIQWQERSQKHPAELAYELEQAMNEEYPMTFSSGDVDEARPYKPHTLVVEDDLPF